MALRLRIDDVFVISGRGIVVTGKVVGGAISVGDRVLLLTGGRRVETQIAAISMFRSSSQSANPGDEVGLQFTDRRLRPNRGDPVFAVEAATDPDDRPSPDPDNPPSSEAAEDKLNALRFVQSVGSAPLLLLPLRLETALKPTGLLVRAFPDSVHIAPDGAALSLAEQQLVDDYLEGLRIGMAETALREALDNALGHARARYAIATVAQGSVSSKNDGFEDDRPVAQCLPERLLAVALRGDTIVSVAQGEPIPRELPVGPSADDTDLLDSTAGTFWMTDFEAALKVGMAIDMPLPEQTAPLSRLVVFGLQRGEQADQASFQALMDAHGRRGKGLTSPAVGTPTKGSESLPFEPPRDEEGGKSLARALALNADPLSQPTPNADGLQAILAEVIWESAVRPAVINLFDPDLGLAVGEELAPLAKMKQRFMALRPQGQLPLMRLGDDPYGIAIVQDDRFQTGGGFEPLLGVAPTRSDLAAHARAVLAEENARPGYQPTIAALSRHPQGQIWRARHFLPADLVLDILANIDDPDDRRNRVRLILSAIEAREGHVRMTQGSIRPSAAANGGVFNEIAIRLCGDLVGRDAHASKEPELSDPYLEELLFGEHFWDRISQRVRPDLSEQIRHGPIPVLSMLIEHLVMRCLAEAASAAQTDEFEKRAELLGHNVWLHRGSKSIEAIVLSMVQDFGLGPAPLEAIIAEVGRLPRLPQRTWRLLQSLPRWIATLQSAPPALVHQTMAGLLDALSHRPDIWSEAKAAETLDFQRRQGETRTVVGAYGVIEGPIGNNEELNNSPVQWVAAPSASLATVLAAMWRARTGLAWHEPGSEALLPCDLSAGSISLARPLIVTLRRGDDLSSAIAGLVIDNLQRRGAADLEEKLALFYPTPAGEETLGTSPFDGVEFLKETENFARWRNGPVPQAIRDAHTNLVRSIEALRMVMVAEGAAALAEGRPEAAQAVLANLAMGAAPPSDLAVTEPRRTDATVSLSTALATNWRVANPIGSDLRSLLSPELSQLATLLLGEIAGHVVTDAGETVDVSSLVGSALDLAWMMAPGALGRDILFDQVRDRLGLEQGDSLAFDQQAEDTLWMAGRVHALLAGGRTLRPDDLGDAVRDDWEETARVNALNRTRGFILKWRDQLRRLRKRVDGDPEPPNPFPNPRLPDPGRGNPGRGDPPFPWPRPGPELPERFPRPMPRLDRILQALVGRKGPAGLDALETDLTQRLAKSEAAETSEDALSALLKDMPVVLPFVLTDRRSFDTSERYKHAGPESLLHWIEQSAAVRERLEPLADLATAREMALNAVAVQWGDDGPSAANPNLDWVGGPLTDPDGYSARSSCVVVGDVSSSSGRIGGLFVDQWSETLPPQEGELGLVFDADAPLARAPQTCLLAVQSDRSGWTPREVLQLISQTLDAAQARMLTPADWPEVDDVGGGPSGALGATLPMLWVDDGYANVAASFCSPLLERER